MAALTEKEISVRNVLLNRMTVITDNILPNVKDEKMLEYLTGKIEGYQQAYELLGESLESIKVEL